MESDVRDSRVHVRVRLLVARHLLRRHIFIILDTEGHTSHDVVLEVFTHTRQVNHHINTKALKETRRADTRELKQLRTVDGTCTKNDFLVSVKSVFILVCSSFVVNTSGLNIVLVGAVEENLRHSVSSENMQVLAIADRVKVFITRETTLPVVLVQR